MFDNLTGKKLLILGAYSTEGEIIQAAREMGVYTITTDYNNWDESPSKRLSDEAWDIDWSNMNALIEKCDEKSIDGVIAGFSEKRVSCALELAEKIGLPFYARNADVESIFNKNRFKAACINAGIRVPRQFDNNESIEYPVIVKPSDNGGSKGITICFSDSDLRRAYAKALLYSDSSKVIVEEYLSFDEIMVYFTIHDGKIFLSSMCDRYMHRFDDSTTQLPIGYYFPSKYLHIFQSKNLDKYKKLISNLNIKDGLIAFQAFVIGEEVVPFDPTYRLDGTMAYHMIEKRTGLNVLKMLIHESLTGKMINDDSIEKKENPFFDSPCFELPILLGKGKIAKIEGIEDIRRMENVVYVFQGHFVGDIMPMMSGFSQILCRIHICAQNDENIQKTIDSIFDKLHVEDEFGHELVINKGLIRFGASCIIQA